MQKKMGIRLRHLQGPSQPPRYHNMITNQQNFQQPRKRQRSPSPLNRRKIFPKSDNQFETSHQQLHQQFNQRKNNNQHRQITPPVVSPIMNQPFNSNNNSVLDGNGQYQSEVERLIQSLKKKTIQLQRKQQTITKLKRDLELLRAENSNYIQQIKTLKAQLQFERASKNKMSPQLYPQSIKSNSAQSFYPAQYSSNNNNYQASAQIPTFQKPITRSLHNQPYQQFVQASRDQNRNKVQRNNQRQQDTKLRRAQFDQPQREQDSVLSDYLSPLMVLKADPPSKQYNSAYTKPQNRSTPPKSIKSNSRVQYNIPTKYVQQYRSNNVNKPSFQPQSIMPNPFAKKATQDYFTQGQSSFGIDQKRRQYQPQSLQTIQRNHVQGGEQRPMMESSAAHFNTNFTDDNYNRSNWKQPSQKGKSRRQLAIQDSRQFKFQDFDFSELDNDNSSAF